MCDLSDSLSRSALPVELSRLYFGTATVASVCLLEEEPWNIYAWSKHSSCLRCNTVVQMPDMTIHRLYSYSYSLSVLIFAALQHLYHTFFSNLE